MKLREQLLKTHELPSPVGKVPQVLARVTPVSVVAPPMRFKICITASVSGAAARFASEFIEGQGLDVARRMADRHTVTDDKNSVALFSAGVIRSDLPPGESVSTKEALAGVQLVVLDLDSPSRTEVDHVQTALVASGLVFLMYPTHSWALDAPRWRVVVFLSRVAPVERHAALWAGLGRLVGTCGDESAKKPAQRYYLPSCPIGQKDSRPAAIVGGTVLADPDALMALAPPEAQPITAKFNVQLVNAEALIQRTSDNRTRDARLIAKECPLMAAFFAGEKLGEPEWRAIIGILKYCLAGEAIFQEYSALDPRYDRHETQQKWDGWKPDIPPAKCGASPRCTGCKHNGVITSPVQLADIEGESSGKPLADPVKALASTAQASGIESVMDTNSVLYLVYATGVDGQEVRSVVPASSVAATDALIATASRNGKAPSKATLETLIAQMRHAARTEGRTVQIYLRVAEVGPVIYKDLRPGRIVRIDSNGFEVVTDVTVGVPLFSRGSSAGELPDPEAFTSPRAALSFWLKTITESFSVTARQALILLAVVLDWHRTSTPHPALEIVGPAGCGKSTLSEFVLQLVDPAGDGGRVTVGTAGPDIAAAAQQLYVLPLDNAERFDKATSNLLCIVATGGTLQVRMYYAQSETVSLKLHRPVLVTAVAPACTAPDLLSRVVRIELPVRRTGFSAEGEMRSRWRAELPKLQGVVCTLLVGVLQQLPIVRSSGDWGHRLVDFDQLGEAMVRSAGLEAGTFLSAIGALREQMARRAASGDPFLTVLMRALKTLSEKPTSVDHVKPSAIATLTPALALSVVVYDRDRVRIMVRPEALHQRLPMTAGAFDRGNVVPGSARGLSDAIRRVQPMLSSLAINVDELTARGRTVLRFDFDCEALNET